MVRKLSASVLTSGLVFSLFLAPLATTVGAQEDAEPPITHHEQPGDVDLTHVIEIDESHAVSGTDHDIDVSDTDHDFDSHTHDVADSHADHDIDSHTDDLVVSHADQVVEFHTDQSDQHVDSVGDTSHASPGDHQDGSSHNSSH